MTKLKTSSSNPRKSGAKPFDIEHIINDEFSDCPDIIRRKIILKDGSMGYFVFIETLVDTDLLQRDFITPILPLGLEDLAVEERVYRLPLGDFDFLHTEESVVATILAGHTVFMCVGLNYAISCNLKSFDKRNVEEPATEKNVRGSHEGFVESLNTNISILRRNIKNNRLKFKSIKLGTISHQTVIIAYLEGLANPQLVESVYNKIKRINFDAMLSIGHIEQFITDFPYSPFPQYYATERYDKVSAALMEGRLVVMLSGTPVVLIVPVSYFSFLQATDDYSTNWIFGTFLRLLRHAAVFIAIFLPAIYIAVTSFHYYMVPLNLLVVLAESRVKVPFPPIIEALIMEVVIELLREASIRLPSYIGTTIGVTGGIIIGQAAVEAGIVSSLLIIVVAVTAVATFVIPSYDFGLALRFTRFIVMLATAVFGIIGTTVCAALILSHLVVLESLGQPYLQPLIPFTLRDLKDTFIRAPVNLLQTRPAMPKPQDESRGNTDG